MEWRWEWGLGVNVPGMWEWALGEALRKKRELLPVKTVRGVVPLGLGVSILGMMARERVGAVVLPGSLG